MRVPAKHRAKQRDWAIRKSDDLLDAIEAAEDKEDDLHFDQCQCEMCRFLYGVWRPQPGAPS